MKSSSSPTPPIDGAFCDYVTLPADFAHPVPDSLSDAAVGLLEPLSVGIWANRKGGTAAGSRVFITGAVPTEERRDVIAAVVRELLPEHQVSNHVTVEPISGAPEVERLG